MMQRASSEPASLGWLKIFIGLGIVVVGYWVVFPLILQGAEQREWYRFQGCQKGQRVDCETSLVWQMEAWELPQSATTVADHALQTESTDHAGVSSTATSTMPIAHDPSERRSTKTSDKAPNILAVALENVQQQSGWFRPSAGDKVSVTAQISNAKDVTLYYNAKDVNGLPLVKKLGTMTSKSGGNYAGTFTVPQNMLGELEVRATDGKNESSSLFLPIAAQQ